MSTPTIGTGTTLERDVAPEHDLGQGAKAHIVKEPLDKSKTAQAVVTESRVFGIEIEALCGFRWIPNKSAQGQPVCDLCREMYEVLTGQEGLPAE